jgi:hypothetical protein
MENELEISIKDWHNYKVLYVCFVDRCLSFCTFSFVHCVVCSSSIYRFWLPFWYLQTLAFYLYWLLNINKCKMGVFCNSSKYIVAPRLCDAVTKRTPLKTRGELRYSRRVSSSCSTSGTRRVTLVTNPVISHDCCYMYTQLYCRPILLLVDGKLLATLSNYIHVHCWQWKKQHTVTHAHPSTYYM